ncbi:response regulator [uncultured Desulfuromusa sp.]|uniref:response regulator n=1 Tax=uncultured Desulfuromusa sp. TaxID=219183 RepID=UPI002AA7726B|nr:response regulator [uncultured Desulfuromusa sp.]
MARKKMGEILLESEVISQSDLDQALLRQKGNKKPLGKILEDMEVILEEDIAKALSTQFGFPYVKRFSRHRFPQQVLDKIDAETALAHLVFPLKIDKKTLYLAMSNPLDMSLQSDLSFKLAMRISPCVATPDEIKTAIKKHYLTEVPSDKDDDTLNILLVDNQDIVLNAAEAAMRKEGYTIYKAKNGAEGLKIATQLHPHLIITDIAMPRMDGIEMFKALQANGEIENIPVIALSAKTAAEDEANLLGMGFFDFIAKPINPIRLLARVKRALKIHERK